MQGKKDQRGATNTLYYGDNLDVLRRYIKDESVDLVYLDPPFNSQRNYNAVFKGSEAQANAFNDTWGWGPRAQQEYDDILKAGGKLADTVSGLRTILRENDMLAYLCMMAPRLAELRRVLKPTGTIYLHCDNTASHYLKVVMDAVFGYDQFRNEVVWCYTGPGNHPNDFGRKHDTIFRYTKGGEFTFNTSAIRVPYKSEFTMARDLETLSKGSAKTSDPELMRERHEKGKIPEDWWLIASNISAWRKELVGYPTQKPEDLLERIIRASSNPKDVVLDPFCGCGTAVAVAQKEGRRWIGIDITHVAVSVIRSRLTADGVDPTTYEVVGIPKDEAGAEELFNQDPYQFQAWACGLAGVHPNMKDGQPQKGADQGIDGRLRYQEVDGTERLILAQVKGGKTSSRDIRDLSGTMRRQNATFGFFITLNDATKEMTKEAATVGTYRPAQASLTRSEPYMRLQIRTVKQLLDGEKFDYPAPH